VGKLDISQYIDSSHGNLIEPPVAHQTVEIGDEPTLSAPLHKLARCIRIVSDVDCLIGIAVGQSEPHQRLAAGQETTRIVQPGEGFLISAVAAAPQSSLGASSSLWNFGDLSNALELIARPAAAKERLDAIADAMAQAQALIAEANRQVATSAATVKSHQESMQKEAAEHAAKLSAERQSFSEQRLRDETALMSRSQRLSEQESQLKADQESLSELQADLAARAEAFKRATEPMRSAGRK
jgi:hypothetical protein